MCSYMRVFTVLNFAVLSFVVFCYVKNLEIKDSRIKSLVKFKHTKFDTRTENSNHRKTD